jgi:hypothetical protein
VPIPVSSLASRVLDSTRMATTAPDPIDYTLAIKNKGRPPKSWRWEIYEAGKSKAVQQSEFFETMSDATRAGKAVLAKIRANRSA